MILDVNAAAIGVSAATESGISAEMGTATAVAAGALTAVLPMGADLDSLEFAAVLNAVGASYIGTASEHVVTRNEFAGAEDVAAGTYVATDVINNASLAL